MHREEPWFLYQKIPIPPKAHQTRVSIPDCEDKVSAVKQASSGGSYLVRYSYKLQPNNSETIQIFCSEDEATQECIPSIAEGVELFLEQLKEEGVSVWGFDLRISGCVVHPVDFKPFKYKVITALTLNKLATKFLS